MARKYECMPGRFAWNLEECEEEILIAAYDEICRFIPADQQWRNEFENHFFDHGNGVAVDFIDQINAVRRRRGLDTVHIRETDVFDYGRAPDKLLKSNRRCRVREELSGASEGERQRRVEVAKAEEQSLPPPHMTYEEYKARQRRHDADSALSRMEVTSRLIAQQAATAAQSQVKPLLSAELAARMLAIASPNMWIEIIPRLSAEDALIVAEKIEGADLRDALLKHSLSTS